MLNCNFRYLLFITTVLFLLVVCGGCTNNYYYDRASNTDVYKGCKFKEIKADTNGNVYRQIICKGKIVSSELFGPPGIAGDSPEGQAMLKAALNGK